MLPYDKYYKSTEEEWLEIQKSSYHTIVQILVNFTVGVWRGFPLAWDNDADVGDRQRVLGHVLQSSSVS